MRYMCHSQFHIAVRHYLLKLAIHEKRCREKKSCDLVSHCKYSHRADYKQKLGNAVESQAFRSVVRDVSGLGGSCGSTYIIINNKKTTILPRYARRDLANVAPATCLMRWMILFSSSGVVTGLRASSRCCCLMCVSGRFLRLTVAVRRALDLGECLWDSDSTSCTLLNSSSTHTHRREREKQILCSSLFIFILLYAFIFILLL